MKATDLAKVRSTLSAAADEFRANSKLTSVRYRNPVLGLVFLAYAESRFDAVKPEVEAGHNVRTIGGGGECSAGAPIDHMDIPDSVAVRALQYDGDHVPRLDGTLPHQELYFAQNEIAHQYEFFESDTALR